jgi:hypothetical protein
MATEQKPTISEMAVQILRVTRDGMDLAPQDLGLVQLASNSQHRRAESEFAPVWAMFNDLYERCIQGRYAKPWLHGVEHLTKDHQGYVYWKGEHVEHYSFGRDVEGERAAASKLGAKCRALESRGVPVNSATAISDRFTDISGDSPWLRPLTLLYTVLPQDDGGRPWAIFGTGSADVALALRLGATGPQLLAFTTGMGPPAVVEAYHTLAGGPIFRPGEKTQGPTSTAEWIASLQSTGLDADTLNSVLSDGASATLAQAAESALRVQEQLRCRLSPERERPRFDALLAHARKFGPADLVAHVNHMLRTQVSLGDLVVSSEEANGYWCRGHGFVRQKIAASGLSSEEFAAMQYWSKADRLPPDAQLVPFVDAWDFAEPQPAARMGG